MTHTPVLAVAALLIAGACSKPAATGRADNDMLRFSASNYMASGEFQR